MRRSAVNVCMLCDECRLSIPLPLSVNSAVLHAPAPVCFLIIFMQLSRCQIRPSIKVASALDMNFTSGADAAELLSLNTIRNQLIRLEDTIIFCACGAFRLVID